MSNEHQYHPEELDNAQREGRPVLVSRLFTAHHLEHKYPLGTLVEVKVSIVDGESSGDTGSVIDLHGTCKLYVVGHSRDCDGTPLYELSAIPVHPPSARLCTDAGLYRIFAKCWVWGYGEESLKPTGESKELIANLREYTGLWVDHE